MSLPRARRRLLLISGIVAVLVLCAGVLLPVLAPSPNCGGNSAALAACHAAFVSFSLVAAENGKEPVSIAALTASQREYFRQVAGSNWLGGSKLLVTRARIRVGATTEKEPIAVCDAAFDNVPRRMFGKAPLTHAVAYADGSTALLSVEEFRRLDLSTFVDVRTLSDMTLKP